MIAELPRTILDLRGEDVAGWLDGLITNAVATDGPTFAALLTAQGKIISDMMITPIEGGYRIDTPNHMGAELKKRLMMYKLRAPITIEDVSDTQRVYAIWGEDIEDAVPSEAVRDPRHPSLGWRLISPLATGTATLRDYDSHRLSLGIPDSQFDFESVKVFPADACMDELNGVDLKKGCFVGQEVVSRMHRMTTVKKRMRGLILNGDANAGDPVMAGTRRIGDVLHVNGHAGMALIRLERLAAAEVSPTVNDAPVTIMDGPNG
jgi:folate-binding protein YgfZ